jgi:hypothetical protein
MRLCDRDNGVRAAVSLDCKLAQVLGLQNMAHSKDKDVQESGLTTDHGEAGRIEADGSGNRVWRWARDVLDSTSILLKRLENKDLAIEPTQKLAALKKDKSAVKKPATGKQRVELSVAEPEGRDGSGGFDPYNSR